jgi:polyferredoxin
MRLFRLLNWSFTLIILANLSFAEDKPIDGVTSFLQLITLPRVWITVIFAFIGLILLIKKKANWTLRLLAVVLITFVFTMLAWLPLGAFANGMSLHPSPICVFSKPFLFANAGRPIPLIFIIIFTLIMLLTFVGKKLFCGWACPLGALQELVYHIPLPKRWKQKLPFFYTNFIRIMIFVAFILFVLIANANIYDYYNPFESMHWELTTYMWIVLITTLLVALFTFRPFCYLICPIGLFTWLVEHISIYKVKVDDTKCTQCNICIKKSPCPTVPYILKHHKSQPDCHACGRCIEVCPEDALRFKS